MEQPQIIDSVKWVALPLFSSETKAQKSPLKLQYRTPSHPHILSSVSWLLLTFRDQARNLKLWMELMSGRGLTESNKRCHWINKLHMPWKHRQPVSDNIGMAAHKSLIQTTSSNTALASFITQNTCVYGRVPLSATIPKSPNTRPSLS